MREVQLGGLRARMAGGTDGHGGGTGNEPAIVLMHGFGAPGDDLVVFARALGVPREVRFVFPEAPMALGHGYGDGRAWWMIDMARLQRRAAGGDGSPRAREVPEGLARSRDLVLGMLDALATSEGIRSENLVLGGFSQGAMLATDVTLHTERKLAGLVVLSGTLIARDEWSPRMNARAGLPVFQSHGRDDEILAYAGAEALRDELRAAGIEPKWVPFGGGHGIPPEVLKELGGWLRGVWATG